MPLVVLATASAAKPKPSLAAWISQELACTSYDDKVSEISWLRLQAPRNPADVPAQYTFEKFPIPKNEPGSLYHMYSVAAIHVRNPVSAYLVKVGYYENTISLYGMLPPPPRPIAEYRHWFRYPMIGGLRLGDPADKIAQRLGTPHVRRSCGQEIWSYRYQPLGAERQVGFVVEKGRIALYYDAIDE